MGMTLFKGFNEYNEHELQYFGFFFSKYKADFKGLQPLKVILVKYLVQVPNTEYYLYI